jgi:hypothetical protein
MNIKEYREYLDYNEVEEDLDLLEELIETEFPEEAGDEWVIE